MHEDVAEHVSNLLWLLPTVFVTYALKLFRDLAKSVEHLNQNIALLLFRVDEHSKLLGDHEDRLRDVERTA